MKDLHLSAVVLIALAGCAARRPAAPVKALGTDALTVRSGGHVRPVLETLIPLFERQAGVRVHYLTGGSGKMLAEALEKKDTDVYIAADLRHVRRAEEQNCVTRKIPLVTLRPAIVVRKGNPKRITALADLTRRDMRVFLESPKGCQLGNATAMLLARHHLKIVPSDTRMDGRPPSVRTAASFLTSNRLDAAIVWDSTARRLSDRVDMVPIPRDRNVDVHVVGVIFRFSPNPDMAAQFLRFLSGKANRHVWTKHGFAAGSERDTVGPRPKTQ